MKRKYIIAVAVLIGLCLCVVVFPMITKEIHIVRMHSAYEALRTSLILELSSYYRENSRYPESLHELTGIEYSDGATPELLIDFKYVPNGNSCELSYFSAYFEKELKDYMIEGKLKWEEDN